MIVLFHVLIAILSVVYATSLFFRPSKAKLYTSYGLVTLTLTSGTYLVLSTHAHLMSACITGLVYTVTVSLGLIPAHYKLHQSKYS